MVIPRSYRTAVAMLGLATQLVATSAPMNMPAQGIYFAKKQYQPQPLPRWEGTRDLLPAPVLDEHPEWVRMYWKTWELAFRNFHEPVPGSGCVSQFIDAAFNENIFLWDTAFMTLFCNYGHGLVPGIGSLDNFYARQHEDGEICREINRRTGADYVAWCNTEGKPLFSRWGWNFGQPGLADERNAPVEYRGRPTPQPAPVLTLDALDNPLLAWAELESLRVTGDRSRLASVYPPLVRYHAALEKYLRQGNGLYLTDWASMDNSPRNPFLRGGGCGVDISSQMVLFARNLASMAAMLDRREDAAHWNHEADSLAALINQHMWDAERQFYFDLKLDGTRVPVKTVAAFWTMLAGVAQPEQVRKLVAQLNNPATFNRAHRVPTLAADERGFDPQGAYWSGSVWLATTTMAIRGLEQNNQPELAREIALGSLGMMGRVFEETGTIWENYAPDAAKPGSQAKADFVGFSGVGPIVYLLEFAIGLKPDAIRNELVWDLRSAGRVGCERYRFNGHLVSLVAEPLIGNAQRLKISVESDAPFTLIIKRPGQQSVLAVTRGKQELLLPQL
jgi:hypothetical protein